jgi:hypothetical protein
VAKAQTKKAETTAVSTKVEETQALIVVQDEVPDYIKQDGPARGSENVTTDDIVIPRLEIIQALSPAVKDGDPGYIDDARPGMLMNSVTKQLYGKEVMVIPVYYSKQWLVWKKRKDKDGKPLEGGFFGAYNTPHEAQERANEEGGEAGNIEVLDTPQHLCLLIDSTNGKTDEVMISMPRTKAKISRQWNSMVRLAGGDRFARAYRITSTLEKKQQGDYYNFSVSQSGFPARQLYDKAEKLWAQINSGARNVVVDVDGFGGDEVEHTDAEM